MAGGIDAEGGQCHCKTDTKDDSGDDGERYIRRREDVVMREEKVKIYRVE